MAYEEILAGEGLEKGNLALTPIQFRKRIHRYVERNGWLLSYRLENPEGYEAWRIANIPLLTAAKEAFAFNHSLKAYQNAVKRLARPTLNTPQDDAERSAAQSVVTNTPQEVKDFVG